MIKLQSVQFAGIIVTRWGAVQHSGIYCKYKISNVYMHSFSMSKCDY